MRHVDEDVHVRLVDLLWAGEPLVLAVELDDHPGADAGGSLEDGQGDQDRGREQRIVAEREPERGGQRRGGERQIDIQRQRERPQRAQHHEGEEAALEPGGPARAPCPRGASRRFPTRPWPRVTLYREQGLGRSFSRLARSRRDGVEASSGSGEAAPEAWRVKQGSTRPGDAAGLLTAW